MCFILAESQEFIPRQHYHRMASLNYHPAYDVRQIHHLQGENSRKGQAVDHLGSCGNPIAERNVPVIGAVKHLATKPLVRSGNRIVYSNPVLAFLGQLIDLSQPEAIHTRCLDHLPSLSK